MVVVVVGAMVVTVAPPSVVEVVAREVVDSMVVEVEVVDSGTPVSSPQAARSSVTMNHPAIA